MPKITIWRKRRGKTTKQVLTVEADRISGRELLELVPKDKVLYPCYIDGRVNWEAPIDPKDVVLLARDREFAIEEDA